MAKIEESYLKDLSKPWQNFFKKFDEINDIKVSQWKKVHVLAYICKRYEDHYNRKFSVAIKSAPTKSPDMHLVNRMIVMLETTNMRTVKEYIDWIYDYKIIPKNKKIRTLAFFMTSGLGNEFYFFKKENEKITRSTLLPPEYRSIADTLSVNVSTFGDLAFIVQAVKQSPNSKSREPYKILLEHLKSLGFEESELEGMK